MGLFDFSRFARKPAGEAPTEPALTESGPELAIDDPMARFGAPVPDDLTTVSEDETEVAEAAQAKPMKGNGLDFSAKARAPTTAKPVDIDKPAKPAGPAGPDFSSFATPLANEPIPGATREPTADDPNAFMQGLTGSLIGTNPKLAGAAAEGFGVLLDSPALMDAGRAVEGYGDKTLEGYKARVPSFTGIRTDGFGNFLEDLGAYAGHGAGSAIGTSFPSLVVGTGVAAMTANPWVGLIGGAAGPSYIQNFGDVYGSVRDNDGIKARIAKGELTQKQAAEASALAAVPIAALDALSIGTIFGTAVWGNAKKTLVRDVTHALVTGGLTEGGTEGLQEVISQWAQRELGGNTELKDAAISVVDNAFAGLFGGGLMSGGASTAAYPGQVKALNERVTKGRSLGFPAQEGDSVPDLMRAAQQTLQNPNIPAAPVTQEPPEAPLAGEAEVVITPAPSTPDLATGPGAEAAPAPTAAASPEEVAVLRKENYSDADIADMEPEERAATIAEILGQTAPAPTPRPQLAPDTPSAEPIKDLLAQAADLADAANPRQALWMARPALDQLRKDRKATKQVYASGERLANFDGQGGALIARDKATAARILKARDLGLAQLPEGVSKEDFLQALIGKYTGAGSGKPADGDAVVQQVTADGAVTRERLVAGADALESAEEEFSAPDRGIQVLTPEQAVQRREEEIAAEGAVPDAKAPDFSDAGAHRKTEWNGLGLSIETDTDNVRAGSKNGKPWTQKFTNPYGDIDGTMGADDMPVDVYVGPLATTDAGNPKGARAYIIDELGKPDGKDAGKFRQHKVLIGFANEANARAAYAATEGKSEAQIGAITEVDVPTLKAWLARGKVTQPYAEMDEAETETDGPKKRAPITRGAREAYDGPELTAEEIDVLAANWAYVREVEGRGRPQSLTAYVIAEGGLKDDAREVRHIAGEARQRPGLVNKDGSSLDDMARRAWESGFLPGERPTVAEFLDALQDDLHTGLVVRAADETALEDIKIADEIARELEDYGIIPAQFRTEDGLRQWLGQDIAKPQRPVREKPAGRAQEPEGEEAPFDGVGEAEDVKADLKPGARRQLGYNADGNPVWEDHRGVRSYVEKGIRIAETVGLIPGGGFEIHKPRHAEFEVASTEKPKPAVTTEKSGQTSLVPEATTKEKLAAEEKARGKKGGNAPMDVGMFGDAKDQTDLVDLAKQPDKQPDTKAAKSSAAPTEKPDKQPDTEAAETPLDAVKSRLMTGEGFAGILEARKFLKEHGFDGTVKEADELIEQAAVLAARDIVAGGGSPSAIYNALVDLYGRQPNLNVRTSESVSKQAYSTPLPLAYVASRLAGVATADVVYEPSAGNGALLIEATDGKRQHVYANELDDARGQALFDQGFRVSGGDAVSKTIAEKATTVIANPPFGAVREDGQSKSFTVDGFQTTQVDHAIALSALSNLTNDGKAVLILGGVKADSIEELRKGYRGQAKREFYYKLYHAYNVVDHFTVKGELYQKQGAGWPVDVVIIDGRRADKDAPLTRSLPAANPPSIIGSWDALAAKLPGETDAQPVRERGGDKVPGAAQREPESESGNARGERPATGSGADAVRPASEGEAGGVRQRGDRGQPGDDRADQGSQDRVRPSQGGERRGDGQPAAAGGRGSAVEAKSPAPKKAPVERVKNTTGQTSYAPSSSSGSLNTLVPSNMADATRNALAKVEAKRGSVDAFVATALNYKPGELGKYFSAEQIDAIAAAIDNVEKGAAFILGDQTGIGKGRVVAAMLRYGLLNDLTPVLLTEKPDLYGDMYRDLRDIGMEEMLGREPRMFMTNTSESVTLDEEALKWKEEAEFARSNGEKQPPRRGKFLMALPKARYDAAMAAIAAWQPGSERPFDVVFTTYDQMNTVKGADTVRRGFIDAIAPRAFIAMDEAHNAGGAAQTGWKKEGGPKNRADFARELTQKAAGLIYSSATYAKRPDVMDLYARTDMGKAVDDPKLLPELIEKGGVPMQQVVASMLAESGQYMRRERSFEGINYNIVGVPVSAEAYTQFTQAIRGVFQFDLAVAEFREEFMEQALDEMGGAKTKDSGVGEAAAHATSFAGIMHNIVNQMLLAIKVDQTADRAITALQDGKKPVIGLANTMESFIGDFADANDIKLGQAMELDFGDVLQRYLDRTLRITIKDGEGKKTHVVIPLGDLPGELQAMFKAAKQRIADGEYANMPISPIDWLRHRLGKAGYSIAEVTGRQTMLDYSGDVPKYVARPKKEMGPSGKRGSIARFNGGALDVLVINRSGSTGVSMHAKSDFKDRRPRRMLLLQAEGNIDTHMQMLGRVNRTGQVVLPDYEQIAAEIPAEARPTAVLMKKMASLNANTTGARGSVFLADSVDFMNEYGDKVVAEILVADPATDAKLGTVIRYDEKNRPILEGVARKATGRLVLLDPAEQQEFLDEVQRAYKAEIARLDSLGENALEAKNVDLQAKTLEKTTLKEKQGDSPFLDAAVMEKVSAKAQGRAMAPGEVAKAIAKSVGEKISVEDETAGEAFAKLEPKGRADAADLVNDVKERTRAWIAREVGLASDDAKVSVKTRHEANLRRWIATAELLYPGRQVTLELPNGELTGIVTAVAQDGKAKNPAALSVWEATIAVPDSSRQYTFPFSKLFPSTEPKSEDEAGVTVRPANMRPAELAAAFTEARKEGRETRFIITGNVLAGYDQVVGKGQIVNYTTEDGDSRPGVLMPRGFELKKFLDSRAIRFTAGEQVTAFLDKVPEETVKSKDGVIKVTRSRDGNYQIALPAARATGGRYYTEEAVRKALAPAEFVKSGADMKVAVDKRTAGRVLEALRTAGALFETKKWQLIAQEIITKNPPKRAYIGSRLRRNSVLTALKMGKAVSLKSEAAAALAEMRKTAPIVPEYVREGVVERIEPYGGKGNVKVTARDTGGNTYEFYDTIDGVHGTGGLFDVLPDGTPALTLFSFDGGTGLGQVFHGVRAHEGVHALRASGLLPGEAGEKATTWGRLVGHAEALGVMGLTMREFGRKAGHPLADTWSDSVTIMETYLRLFKDVKAAVKREHLAEEAVAHMTQVYKTGGYTAEEVAPVKDILDAILSGEVATREPVLSESRVDEFAAALGLVNPQRAFISRFIPFRDRYMAWRLNSKFPHHPSEVTGMQFDGRPGVLKGGGTFLPEGQVPADLAEMPANSNASAGYEQAAERQGMAKRGVKPLRVAADSRVAPEAFFDAMVDAQDGASLTDTAAYEAYLEWAEDKGLSAQAVSLEEFRGAMRELGIMSGRLAGRVRWFGIALRAQPRAPMRATLPKAEREVDALGFYDPNLEAAKAIPQEKGTVQQLRAMLIKAGGSEKGLAANGFDTAFPDPNAKMTKTVLVEWLRANRLKLGHRVKAAGSPLEWAVHDADGNFLGMFETEEEAFDYVEANGIGKGWEVNSRASESTFVKWSTPGGIPGSYREVVTTLPFDQAVRVRLGEREAKPMMYEGRHLVEDASQVTFKIGLEEGRITHWPTTYNWKGEPQPGKYVVYSANMQNAGFASMEAAVAAIEDGFNRRKNAAAGDGLGKGREGHDIYTSSHWPGIPNPAWHRRTKLFDNGDGTKTSVGEEFQADAQEAKRKADNAARKAALAAGREYVARDGVRDSAFLADIQERLTTARRTRDAVHEKAAAFINTTPEFDTETGPVAEIWEDYNKRAMDGVWHPQENSALQVSSFLHSLADVISGTHRQTAIALADKLATTQDVVNDLVNKEDAARGGLPEIYKPFLNTSDWLDPNLKGWLAEAAKDPTVTRLAWPPGSVQADRFSIAKHVGEIYAMRNSDGTYWVVLEDHDSRPLFRNRDGWSDNGGKTHTAEQFRELVGRELADKAMANADAAKPTEYGAGIRGGDLKVGGAGMRAFYGDFAKDGAYTPGIVGTRLLKLLRALDPQARIGTNDFVLPDADAMRFAMFEALKPLNLHQQQRNQLVNEIEVIAVEKGGLAELDEYEAPKEFEEAWRLAVNAAKNAPRKPYPSISLTPALREKILAGLPLFGKDAKGERFNTAISRQVDPRSFKSEEEVANALARDFGFREVVILKGEAELAAAKQTYAVLDLLSALTGLPKLAIGKLTNTALSITIRQQVFANALGMYRFHSMGLARPTLHIQATTPDVLIHEFGHMLDHAAGRAGGKIGMATQKTMSGLPRTDFAWMSPKLKAGFEKLSGIFTAPGGTLRGVSRSLEETEDKPGTLAPPAEMFARGFEYYTRLMAKMAGLDTGAMTWDVPSKYRVGGAMALLQNLPGYDFATVEADIRAGTTTEATELIDAFDLIFQGVQDNVAAGKRPAELLATAVANPQTLPQPVKDSVDAAVQASEGIIRRIAGKSVTIEYAPFIPTNLSAAEEADLRGTVGADRVPGTVGGFYQTRGAVNGGALIRLATQDPAWADDLNTASYHEAWHHVKERLANAQEKAILHSPAEAARLRAYAAGEFGMRPDDPALGSIDPREIEAYAFQRYAREREMGLEQAYAGNGLLIATRQFFERMYQMLRRISNALRGHGYGIHEDVFDAAYEGDIAAREDAAAVDLPSYSMLPQEALPTAINGQPITNIEDIGPNDPHPGPVLAYHGTDVDFDRFDASYSRDFGIHFGTREQANDRTDPGIGVVEGGRVLPAVLALDKVFLMPDLFEWELHEVADSLAAEDPVFWDIPDAVDALINKNPDAAVDLIRQRLTAAGYDGIRYWNEVEGGGGNAGWSYIVWAPGKVRSATTGERLMTSVPRQGMQPNDGAFITKWMDWTQKQADSKASITDKSGKSYTVVRKFGTGSVTYTVRDGRSDVASFYVRSAPWLNTISVANAGVIETHQRRGIATAVYNLVEADTAALGAKLMPQGRSSLSTDGRAFWAKRDAERLDAVDGDRFNVAIPRARQIQPPAPGYPGVLGRRVQQIFNRVMPSGQTVDHLRVKLQDADLPVQRIAVERIEQQLGIEMPVNLDTYVAKSLYVGRAGERLTDLETEWVEPIIEAMKLSGISMEEMGEYMQARHAEERNAKIATLYEPGHDFHEAATNPSIVGGSGWSATEAQATLAGYHANRRAGFESVAKIIDAMQEETRKILLRSGLIDRETYDDWSTQYANYVPLRGFEIADPDDPEGMRSGRGFDIRGKEALPALGRRSKSDNPVAYAVLQAMQAIVRAEKNRVGKTLMRAVEQFPDKKVWEMYRGEYKRRINPSTGLVETYWVPPPWARPDELYGVKVGGKQRWILIRHPALARAMRGTNGEYQNAVLRGLMGVMRFYATMLTSWNPEFTLPNFFRDLETALGNVTDVKDKPEGIRKKILKDAFSAKSIRGIFQALRHGKHATHEYAKWFDEYRLAGGKISFMEFNDVERIKRQIESDLKDGSIRKLLRTRKGFMQLLEDANTAVENGVRLSVYIALRKHGVPQDRAAFVSRELTVNFNRRGEWGSAINALYLFFNASVQGSTRLIQAVGRSKALRLAVGGIFVAGMALDWWNWLLAGEDEDGSNYYDRMEDWVKQRNIIVMYGAGRNDAIMIPLAYGYNVPYLAGQQFNAMLRGARSPVEAAATLGAVLLDQFNPLGSDASFWQLLAPTFIDPGIQTLENKTWYGGPIYPQKFDKRTPDSQVAYPSTPWYWKQVAETLNAVSGGNTGKPGYIDVSPETLEHYVHFVGGGVGKFVANALQFGNDILAGREWLPEKTPILRRFYNKETSQSKRREFYDSWNVVDQGAYEVDKLKKNKQDAEAKAARTRNAAELEAYPAMAATMRKLKTWREQRDTIAKNAKLSEEEKRQKTDAVIERENAAIANALAKYHAALKKYER
jgi:predicted RNA methylase